jgi:hypothetical protein
MIYITERTNKMQPYSRIYYSNYFFTTRHPTDSYIGHKPTHTTYTHIPNKQLDEANKRRSGNALSTKDDP